MFLMNSVLSALYVPPISDRKYIRAHGKLTHRKGVSEYAALSHRESIRANFNFFNWENVLSNVNSLSALLIALFARDLVPFFFGIRIGWSGFDRALPGLSALIMSGLLDDGLGETLVVAIGHILDVMWRTV